MAMVRLILFLLRGWLRWQIIATACLFWVRKDHPSGNRLQDTSYSDFNLHVHILPSALNDDHGAVIKVTYALSQLFAILHDFDINVFAWKQNRFDRMGEFLDVENFHALQLCHAIEIEVAVDHEAVPVLDAFDQLTIHFDDA